MPQPTCFQIRIRYYFRVHSEKDIMSNFENIKLGITAESLFTVDEKHSVKFTKVPVLSTPMMISLMEGVCKELIQGQLPPDFVTVGYEVHVKHKAAAVVGAQVKTWGRLLEVDGRKLLFEVRVTEGDRVIGDGTHRRTIIPNS
jgi:fluoroacetyl-CoA thioesterase